MWWKSRKTSQAHSHLGIIFGGKNQEATSSQVHLQDSQPLPLPIPLAHIEEVGEFDISNHDELEEDIQVNSQSS